MPDWGNVAVGVRISKYPEPLFFNSWTAFIMRGLRQGDTVLMPEMHQPAHWAANALARQFLASGRDTLLLIDDDMTFDFDALGRLRAHEPNHEYDIVMAICTHRNWPPKPVVMAAMEQPTDDRARKGEFFQTLTDWEPGAVIPVAAVGLAFTLIRRSVIEALRDDVPDDLNFWFSYGPGFESDDIPFCRNARAAGFRLAVDTTVEIGHIATIPMSAADWRRYQEAQRNGQGNATRDTVVVGDKPRALMELNSTASLVSGGGNGH